MPDTRDYLKEIQQNLEKLKARGSITESENALFGMIDGLAGMLHRTNERVTVLEKHVAHLEKLHRKAADVA